MKHSNCHARSKQKRKQLRQKNFKIKLLIRDTSAAIARGEDTPKRRAGEVAINIQSASTSFAAAMAAKRTMPKGQNQRQRRKLDRQQPHGKKH